MAFEIRLDSRLKELCTQDAPTPLDTGCWWIAKERGAGLEGRFEPGMLDRFQWLSIDFLLDGTEAVKLVLELKEGEEGPAFRVTFGLLNQCQARLRLPLSATDQNRWMLPREAALLKPLCGGAKVNLDRVDRLRLAVEAKGDAPVRWCMTPMMASVEEPSRIDYPRLPAGKLVDDLGQWTLKSWKGKRRSRQEVRAGLARQHTAADDAAWPAEFSRWGGDSRVQFAATGFFHTHHDGKRWWLVDPDGHSFWSAGPDCVRSSMGMHVKGLKSALSDPAVASNGGADYLQANFRDAFGEQWHSRWVEITLAFLKSTGFNTVANWSEWEVASRAGFPYVRPLSWQGEVKTARVFRDMPDVFHPDFESDVDAFARQLASTRDDPAMIGYFLMNEPTWGFASQTPAEGMLYATTECVSRREFANWLRHKYSDSRGLASAWGAPVAVESVESGQWNERTPPGAAPDLEAFSTVMVERLFGSLTRACRAVDPHHLNLGARYHIIPPKWALDGLGGFDIFSINCYNTKVRRDLGEVCQRIGRPAMVGEWHFGAHDAGLPASGIGRVADQTARGQAYRVYLEDAAALPWCVGAHWFTLYDQAVLGRGDGENYQIGFLDVCNQPYEEITTAARRSHERLYDLAWGRSEPFSQEPEYLPRLFY